MNENNNRDWFNLHQDIYLAARSEVELFVDHLILNIKIYFGVYMAAGGRKSEEAGNFPRF
ncbi:MAG TPA: DUF2461 family protein [Bacteroidetes bacterium]|nr:DUF2461 family protein [Bacteroidota bacterium]